MLRCNSCLIPDTRPDTEFVDGRCSACLNFERRKSIDWGARQQALEVAVDSARAEAKRNGSEFDCIVPSSGGKDSTYQVIKLIELGMKPLVVTATTCHLTQLGRANIENLKRFATTIEFTPNTVVRAKLNRHGLRSVGDISYPEHMAIFSIPFRIAAAMNINTIFYGESPQQEYGCPLGAEEAMTMTRRWVAEFGGLLGLRADDCIGVDGITERDMRDYRLPDDEAMNKITAHFLGQFIPWDSHRNANVARNNGFLFGLPSAANLWSFENLDNAQTGLHDHAMYRKYGYGRLASQLSVDIRNGLISREAALAIALERDGLFPNVYAGVSFDEMCSRIDMNQNEVLAALDQFTDWSLFVGERSGRPILKAESLAA